MYVTTYIHMYVHTPMYHSDGLLRLTVHENLRCACQNTSFTFVHVRYDSNYFNACCANYSNVHTGMRVPFTHVRTRVARLHVLNDEPPCIYVRMIHLRISLAAFGFHNRGVSTGALSYIRFTPCPTYVPFTVL
jgi:hypothetical protein